ncbi:UNVERIFIED_CONTAM: hypothetical protein Slati_3420200 [Sesamum latifolium]|uniref:Uncharacterized protein n=1 Tax=Sesamum latifolium TaxID=2727402 RepID=A0AAW2UGI2_9LAMI
MEVLSNTANKQKAVEIPGNTQAASCCRDVPTSDHWRIRPRTPGTSYTPFKICRSCSRPPTTQHFLGRITSSFARSYSTDSFSDHPRTSGNTGPRSYSHSI